MTGTFGGLMANAVVDTAKGFTSTLNHYGLVASVILDLRLIEKIDKRINRPDPRRKMTAGQAVAVMIVNGLGFTDSPLYLYPDFFKDIDVEQLFGSTFSSADITADSLSKALDAIFQYGPSKLINEICCEMVIEQKLSGKIANLDSTSLSVEGEYKSSDADSTAIKVTHGHSKDHRPDLRQIVLSILMTGPANLPFIAIPQDGNSSDKGTFHEIIKNVEEFRKNIQGLELERYIADSALYSKDKLLMDNAYKFISRVPETIKSAKELVRSSFEKSDWIEIRPGYKTIQNDSNYGKVHQRWLLIESEAAKHRETLTFNKNFEKKEKSLGKLAKSLGNRMFETSADFYRELNQLKKKFPLFKIAGKAEEVYKNARAGRPTQNQEQVLKGFRGSVTVTHNEENIQTELLTKGRFILATNELDTQILSDSSILEEYKSQNPSCERGFRFLKDPFFHIDSIFLKSERRIEALLMVMVLILFVYNLTQYKVRDALEKNGETIPNQKKKPIKNPTARWVFQLMRGISIMTYCDSAGKMLTRAISNLSDLRKRIICLFGVEAQKIYGLIPASA
jgi:transposase